MSSGLETIRILKERGLVDVWDDVVDLKNNDPFVYSFQTGVNNVVIRGIRIESPGDKGMVHATIGVFEGGSVSGGSNIEVSRFNNIDPPPSNLSDPFTSVFRGRTIDAPGSRFFFQHMVGNKTSDYDRIFNFIFLRKETDYYIVLDNIEDENEMLRIEVLAAVNT